MRAQKLPPPDESRLPTHRGGHEVTARHCQRLLYQFDLRVEPPSEYSPGAWHVYPAGRTLMGRPLEMSNSLQDLYQWLIGYEAGYRHMYYAARGMHLVEKPEVEFEPAVE